MLSWWYLAFVGWVIMGVSDCQDSDPSQTDYGQEDHPDVTVKLSVDTYPKSQTVHVDSNSAQKQVSELFSCHECTNCDAKTEASVRSCQTGVNMCYTVQHANRVVRRGCATSRGECLAPDSDQSNRFETITCCTTPKCNQGIQLHPLFLITMLGLLTTMMIRRI